MGRSDEKTQSNFAELAARVLRSVRAGCEADKLTLVRSSVPSFVMPFIYGRAVQMVSCFATLPKRIDVDHPKKFGKIHNDLIKRY
jgi:hypothetical protein